jgi:peptidoglycan hydrolase CwlO-like protein
MRRSASITGSIDSPLSALSTEVAEREAALTKQLAAAEARAQSAAAERDAIKVSCALSMLSWTGGG